MREHCGTIRPRTNKFQGISVPALRMAFLPVAVVLIFSNLVQLSAASAGDGEIQRLPVIEKQDIHFEALSVGGKPFQKRVPALAQDNYGFIWLGLPMTACSTATDGTYESPALQPPTPAIHVTV